MKITYSKPNTTQWIFIKTITDDKGNTFDKVDTDKDLKPGTTVYTLYSNMPGDTGLRQEKIYPWDEKLSGKRTGRMSGYENIGKILHHRDTMFVKRKP
jgi:hypothetical protein